MSATRDLHERLDAALSHLRMGERDAYAVLLRIHGRVVPAMERWVEAGSPWSGWTPRASLLDSDIIALGVAPPPPLEDLAAPTTRAASWGIQYVLEGSRLGGEVLARQVGAGFQKHYLTAPLEKGAWPRFQMELQEAAETGGNDWGELAGTAARSMFELFEKAMTIELGQTRGR